MSIDEDYLKAIGLDDESLQSKVLEAWKENESGLVKKRDELLGTVNKYKSDLEQAEALKSEHEQLKKRLAEIEDKSMTEEERLQKAKEEAAAEWESKYSESAERLQQMEAKERERLRNEAVFRSVGDKGDSDLILDVIAQRNLVNTIDKDGEYVLQVVGLDGKEVESVDKLVEQMKASEKYSRLFNSSGLSGGGSRNSSGQGGADYSKLFGAAKIRAARGG